jgi:superfamily I DNA and RNA helicase
LRTKRDQALSSQSPAISDSFMHAAYLDKLNPDQRRAVEHGLVSGFPPLLIIAGAGSGKTNTLAHRVAHSSSTAPTRAASC